MKKLLLALILAALTSCDNGDTGRYHIVMGPPGGHRYTMMIDTVTGDSWIICGKENGTAEDIHWCKLEKAK